MMLLWLFHGAHEKVGDHPFRYARYTRHGTKTDKKNLLCG